MKKALMVFALVLALLPAGSALSADRHDSALYVVDISGTVESMGAVSEARRVVQDMNGRFPDYVQSAGLLAFGELKREQLDWLLPVTGYNREELARAAGLLEGSEGPTPLGAAMYEAGKGLESSLGKTALIIISDGQDTGFSDPVKRVEDLKAEYGHNLCVFAIQLGNHAEGGALLGEMVDAGGCGRFLHVKNLRTDNEVQDLVDYIFPVDAPPPPPPPPPAPEDSDFDGVLDPDDQCPGTPRGAAVDFRGCWVLKGVKFDFDKAEIKPEYEPYLNEVVNVLLANPTLKVVVEGHTDAEGPDEYNQKLSEKRANSVMQYFVDKGVSPSRLAAKGFGETKPAAPNDTPEGRAQNRRIELGIVQ